jgi:MFS transporter, DHA2 family, multidrug resistance protein
MKAIQWLRSKRHFQPNKWIIGASVMVGAFMAILDVSVVNVALPHMMGNFGQNLSTITWVATAYSIAAVIMVTMAGWWTTMFGRKRFYLASFLIFIIGSILAGTSHTFSQMIFFRVLQGIGGGSLVPLAQAIMRETFPQKEQGMAMAIFSMGVVLAPAVGPVLGGWLTDNYGWPWIFYINVPICLVGMIMVALFVHDPEYLVRGVKKIDVLGIVLLTLGLTGLQTILERGQQENWFESPLIVWGTIFTALILITLVFWELRVAEPVVNLRVFKNVQFRMGVVIVLLFGIALYGTTFILPQFTQRLLNYSAFQAGLVLMPRALALFLLLPLVGKIYNYFDPRQLMLTGIVIVSVSYYQLAHLATTVAAYNIVPILLLMGAGMPFIFVSLTTASLSTIPKTNMTSASGLFNLFQQVGGNLGYALMATLLQRYSQVHHAYLGESIALGNFNVSVFSRQVSGALHQAGMAFNQANESALMLINGLVSREAEMMAYNDISLVLMFLFLACIPVVLLMPIRKGEWETPAVGEG